MKSTLFVLAFLMFGVMGSAQSNEHKKATDRFLGQFNNDDFEGIYQSFSASMKKARTKKQYFAFLSAVKKENGKLLSLKSYDYRELSPGKIRGYYEGHFESDKLFVQITTNPSGEITGLFIRKAVIF